MTIVIPNRTKRWFHDWTHNQSDALIDLRIEHGIAFEAWRREREYWAVLQGGYAWAFPDKDSGFPESTASKRQALERLVMLIGQTPLGAQVFGQ